MRTLRNGWNERFIMLLHHARSIAGYDVTYDGTIYYGDGTVIDNDKV